MKRLQAIQKRMKEADLSILVIPSADPHQSEYVAPYWKSRTFATGFTGSAGTALVTQEEGYLWADGRYFIQAQKQIQETGFQLMKMGIPGYPTIAEWIGEHVESGDRIGFDGRVISLDTMEEWKCAIGNCKVDFSIETDWIDKLWTERPSLSEAPIFELMTEFAGKGRKEKLAEVRKRMKKLSVDAYVISSLDDIAWLTNLRGGDVAHTPVFASFFILTRESATLFVEEGKVSKEIFAKLNADQIEVKPYALFYQELGNLQGSVGYDPKRISVLAESLLSDQVVAKPIQEITTGLKAVKNEVELKNLRNCQIEDGAAMVRSLKRIREAVEAGQKLTEQMVDAILIEERGKSSFFLEPSFDTIAAYRSNAAMMHYRATPENDTEIEAKGFLLIDSGGQYYTGTTDITRTLGLGDLTEEEKKDYTLVLKGMIQLTMTKFLKGTSGLQLDPIARSPLWKEGMDYKCGTGHGVGYLLGVHEGPQNFSNRKGAETPLELGMIVTNEPGVYKEGKHGIRTENMLAVQKEKETGDGTFYGFETMTLCPIDTRPIELTRLLDEEKAWLNAYHQQVFEALAPVLSEEEQAFLREETASI
jgi:Xaa-Pro aminopeptidase